MVLWVGANDGPVHVTRDGGKSWANVTPKDIAPGGRVQNIDASHLRRGAAYIAMYRYLREYDMKPYIYKTDDYGKTWKKLTDGANGIPNDSPTRVVREDPEVAGLLYAGTEFGAYVSFDDGAHWLTLQQNLPATPVTDIRVHRGDLVISTMGRAFWIMDDGVALLRQLARRARQRSTTNPPAQAVDSAGTVLVEPQATVRFRSGGGRGTGISPQFPTSSAAIDYILPDGFSGPVSLEISDAQGRIVRSISSTVATGRGGRGGAAGGSESEDPEAQPRGRGVQAPLGAKAGHNRYLWDYRWTGNVPAAPGRYTLKLTAGGVTRSAVLEFSVDPRVMKDGVTTADLVAQQDFLLKVRDAIAEATQARARLQQAMQQAGVQPPPSPGPGQSTTELIAKLQQQGTPPSRLQALWARLVTAPGTYEQGMLIDQLQNIMRAEGGADQKVGQESVRRLDDLMNELHAVEGEIK